MNSKISFCKKAIIKSDIKRYWWISSLYFFIIFFSMTFGLLNLSHNHWYVDNAADSFRFSYIYSYSFSMWFMSILVPIILGVVLFSYLHSPKSASAMHSIPVSRREQYFSHIISGTILFLAPLLLNTVIIMLCRFNHDFAQLFRVSHLITSVSVAIIYSILTFAAACAVSMITGNTFSALLLTFGFGILPFCAESFVELLMQAKLYGYSYDENYSLSSRLYLLPHSLIQCGNIIFYLIITVIFFIAGYFLYKRRKLERSGEVLVYSPLKPLFVFGLGICFGAFGYSYFYGMWNLESILWLLPTGIVGIVIGEMIVKKSLHVLSSYKKVIVYIVLVIVLLICFKGDLLGYERRVPEIDKVESVCVTSGRFTKHLPQSDCYNDTEPIYYELPEPTMTDRAEIQNVINYHQKLVTDKNIPDSSNSRDNLTIKYTLKNGKTIKRNYEISYAENQELIEPIIKSDSMRKSFNPIFRDDIGRIQTVRISDSRLDYTSFLILTEDMQDEINEFVTALKNDIIEADYSDYLNSDMGSFTTISFDYVKQGHYKNGKSANTNYAYYTDEYYVNASFENISKLLEKYKFSEYLPSADDIVSVNLGYMDGREETVSDRNIIESLYAYCNGKNVGVKYTENSCYVEFVLKNQVTFGTYFDTSVVNEIIDSVK